MLPLQRLIRRSHSPMMLLNNFSTKARRSTRLEQTIRYGAEFPDKLLNKKFKIPPHMYLANENIAKQVNDYIDPYIEQSSCDTVMELNPGVGHFTRTLLDREKKFRKILLVESMEHFLPQLHELHTLYPERVKVRHGDVVSLWKLNYQDKMDSGSRVSDMLYDVPQRSYEEDPVMLLFGAVGAYNFFKHLINSIVFQNGIFMKGRCELILAVPPPIYIHLTCSKDVGYLIYRSTSVLFQILFEYRFIASVPREDFLPTQNEYNITKSSKLGKVKSINPDYLYLVKIVPRRNLYDFCQPADLTALWYFVKQSLVSRRNRVIPNLEKWIPGCGPRLIINNSKTKRTKRLYKDEKIEKLPQFSTPCTTMSNKDFHPGINIYTQFGDLTPSQILSLFTQFRRWPEYSQSSFLASLENSMIKMESSLDENIDGVSINEEDDIINEAILEDDMAEDPPSESKKPTKSRKKEKKEIVI